MTWLSAPSSELASATGFGVSSLSSLLASVINTASACELSARRSAESGTPYATGSVTSTSRNYGLVQAAVIGLGVLIYGGAVLVNL